MAFESRAPTAREQPELMVEAGDNLGWSHQAGLGRRELDREGDAVEPRHSARTDAAFESSMTNPPRASPARTMNSAPASDAPTDVRVVGCRQWERCKRRDVLAGHAERFSARREKRHVRRARCGLRRELRDRVDEMFTVVEN